MGLHLGAAFRALLHGTPDPEIIVQVEYLPLGKQVDLYQVEAVDGQYSVTRRHYFLTCADAFKRFPHHAVNKVPAIELSAGRYIHAAAFRPIELFKG